jgi:hypothetical protein
MAVCRMATTYTPEVLRHRVCCVGALGAVQPGALGACVYIGLYTAIYIPVQAARESGIAMTAKTISVKSGNKGA